VTGTKIEGRKEKRGEKERGAITWQIDQVDNSSRYEWQSQFMGCNFYDIYSSYFPVRSHMSAGTWRELAQISYLCELRHLEMECC